MFTIVGLTLDDIWSGSLPQVRLAEALKARETPGNARPKATQPIVIYTSDPADTQGPIVRAQYKERGTFLTLLYLNDAAVGACNEFHIPLRILDQVDAGGLPAKKVIAFEHPSVAPAMK
jgi:hypothetical protein